MVIEKLYDKLTNREDLKNVPIIYILQICIATIEELDNCLKEERNELYEL